MRIATIDDLMGEMAKLWPVSLPDAKRIAAWGPQYRAALSGLDGDQLNAAWHALMAGWTKKAAPLPADILAAHRSAPKHGSSSSTEKPADIFAELRIRDQALRERRHAIAREFETANAALYRAAEKEGWAGLLIGQVENAANILAQREIKRANNIPTVILNADLRRDYAIEYVGDREVITISRTMIDAWRAHWGFSQDSQERAA